RPPARPGTPAPRHRAAPPAASRARAARRRNRGSRRGGGTGASSSSAPRRPRVKCTRRGHPARPGGVPLRRSGPTTMIWMATGERPRANEGRVRGRGVAGTQLPPLLIAVAVAGLLVLVVLGVGLTILLLRGAHRGAAQEVVGSALPPGWQPGNGQGVGQAPPAPGTA